MNVYTDILQQKGDSWLIALNIAWSELKSHKDKEQQD